MDFPTNFLDKFQDIVSQYPDRTAIVDMDGARSTTYRELGELSRRVAAKLCAQGKSGAVSGIDGRSVLVCMDRRMEYVAVEGTNWMLTILIRDNVISDQIGSITEEMLKHGITQIGIMMAGAAYVPLIPEYPQDRVDYIRKDCDAVCCIDAAWMEALGKAAGCEWDLEEGGYSKYSKNRALIVYTSGSTGLPKGIAHNHEGLFDGIMCIVQTLGYDEQTCLRRLCPHAF